MNFVQQVNATSASVAATVWTVAWQSTLLAVVVAGVAWWMKRASPASRYWLWQILILKILIMPLWVVAIPWPNSDVPRAPLTPNAPRVLTRTSARDSLAIEEMAPLSDEQISRNAPPGDLSDESENLSAVSWPTWFLVIWTVGFLGQCARIVYHWARLKRVLRNASSPDERLDALVREAAHKLNVAGMIRTVLTEFTISPFVCGVIRPTLVFSKEVVTSLSDAQLRSVLLHELAHVKRKDLLFGWIPEICRLVWFFHPAVHYAVYRMRLECELACDQLAMLHSGSSSGDYADTLIQVVSGECN
ncbi:MAG: M56 family metallopeptidase [Planctomycetaceae bacterium]